jgi:hypothetical protein
LFDLAGSCSDDWCMARWVEINTGSPVYRIRGDRVVDINTGNPVYRIRGDRVVDINTGNPVYRMREQEQRHLAAK